MNLFVGAIIVVIIAVVAVLIYRNNQKSIEADASKVETIVKSTEDLAKKV